MGRRFIHPMERALVASLVQHHSAKATLLLMQNSLSGATVSMSFIKRAREGYLASLRVPPAPPPPIVRRPVVKRRIAAPVPKPKPPRAPLTFEEKLARVAAGAKLVAVPQFRKPDPNFTLGGVASASL